MLAAAGEDRDRMPPIAKTVPGHSREMRATLRRAVFRGVFGGKRVPAAYRADRQRQSNARALGKPVHSFSTWKVYASRQILYPRGFT
jgi:hypothetical protein